MALYSVTIPTVGGITCTDQDLFIALFLRLLPSKGLYISTVDSAICTGWSIGSPSGETRLLTYEPESLALWPEILSCHCVRSPRFLNYRQTFKMFRYIRKFFKSTSKTISIDMANRGSRKERQLFTRVVASF